ncbi:MAG: hypothetical protein HYR96_11585 [Deltaproteobacteria bacterium]|nr:hypothetical protein [Deltaproteobacteria bacterium]MBI3294944.1 hypothetical protein [Deltaproteobacteria bacterium]
MPKLKTKKTAAPPKPTTGAFFKTRKTREPDQDIGDTITPPTDIAEAIDAFRDAQEQFKHFEGEATVQKDAINDFALGEFSERALKGKNKSFKILGEQSMVTYVVMDASAGLTDEDVENFKERWGEKAADTLIMRDLASIRFDSAVFEANYDAIVEALESLPQDVRESLFKPMLMKARPGAVEVAKKFAKTPEELRELIQTLKIRNYIR